MNAKFFLWLKQVFFHIVTNESSRGLVVWAWWFGLGGLNV